MPVKCFVRFFAFALSCYLVVGMVMAQETVTVKAVGYGRQPRDAERDALRAAVEQAVGMLINAETMTKNEDLIYEQILTYSDGYVESYKKLDEPVKNTSDIYQVTVEAVVRRNKVMEKLEEVRVISSSVAGQALWAQQISKIDGVEDGRRMLEKLLVELDPKKLLQARVVDTKGRVGDEAEPELVIDYDNPENSKIVFFIEICYDLEAYYKIMAPRATQLFSAIGETPIESIAGESPINSECHAGVEGYKGHPYRVRRGYNWYYENPWDERFTGKLFDDTYTIVCLNLGRDRLGISQRFAVYKLDAKAYRNILEKGVPRYPKLNVWLLAGGGEVIRHDIIPLEREYYTHQTRGLDRGSLSIYSDALIQQDADNVRFEITPEFSLGSYLSDTILLKYEAVVHPDDLKKFKTIKLHF